MGWRSRLDLSKVVVLLLTLLLLGLVVFAAYDGCGREKLADCVDGRVLVSPGTFDRRWCIREYVSSGYMDDNGFWQDTSGFANVRCSESEAWARAACEHGLPEPE